MEAGNDDAVLDTAGAESLHAEVEVLREDVTRIVGPIDLQLRVEELPVARYEGMHDEPELTRLLVEGIRKAREGVEREGVGYVNRECVSRARVFGIPYRGVGFEGEGREGVRRSVLAFWRKELGIVEGSGEQVGGGGWSFRVHKGRVESFRLELPKDRYIQLSVMPTSEKLRGSGLDRLEHMMVRRRPERLLIIAARVGCRIGD